MCMCVCVHECVCACVRVCGVCVCACKTTRSNKQSRTNLSNHTCIRHSHAVAPGVCAVAIRKVPRLLGVTPPPLIHPFNLCVIDRRRREVLHVVVKLRQKEGTQVHTISTERGFLGLRSAEKRLGAVTFFRMWSLPTQSTRTHLLQYLANQRTTPTHWNATHTPHRSVRTRAAPTHLPRTRAVHTGVAPRVVLRVG